MWVWKMSQSNCSLNAVCDVLASYVVLSFNECYLAHKIRRLADVWVHVKSSLRYHGNSLSRLNNTLYIQSGDQNSFLLIQRCHYLARRIYNHAVISSGVTRGRIPCLRAQDGEYLVVQCSASSARLLVAIPRSSWDSVGLFERRQQLEVTSV